MIGVLQLEIFTRSTTTASRTDDLSSAYKQGPWLAWRIEQPKADVVKAWELMEMER